MKLIRFLLLLLISLLLISCGKQVVMPESSKPSEESTSQSSTANNDASSSQHQSGSNEPAPVKGSGGYYKDDGPEANPPKDLDKIPDAVPRAEVINNKLNRPYAALGQKYVPMKSYEPYKMRGVASWYGKRFHGNKTSSGEAYDMYQMSAAHTILPIPSYAKVTNLSNGRSTIVRINDRGPFHKDRLIDLSYAAANKIGMVTKGSAEVEVEAIDSRVSAMLKLPKNEQISKGAETKKPDSLNATQSTTSSMVASANEAPTVITPNVGIFVQVAAFKVRESAEKLREKIKSQNLADNVAVESWYNAGTYRVRLGPYESRTEAETSAAAIKQKLGISAIVINQK